MCTATFSQDVLFGGLGLSVMKSGSKTKSAGTLPCSHAPLETMLLRRAGESRSLIFFSFDVRSFVRGSHRYFHWVRRRVSAL